MGKSQNAARLTGTVEDVAANPVAGVAVAIVSLDRVLQTNTAADGAFSFEDVADGAYEVELTAAGFAKQKLDLHLQENRPRRALSIVLRVGDQPDMELCGTHSSITYGPLGSLNLRVSGIVRDLARRIAVVNAEVTIWRLDDLQAAMRSYSNGNGRFVFENVPAGRYEVRIAKSGYSTAEIKQLLKPHENEVFIETTVLRGKELVVCQ